MVFGMDNVLVRGHYGKSVRLLVICTENRCLKLAGIHERRFSYVLLNRRWVDGPVVVLIVLPQLFVLKHPQLMYFL
jgi:hypothetical protein